MLNASLLGFLRKAFEISPGSNLFGALNGVQGLVQDSFVQLTADFVDRHHTVSEMPGAWLGAGRWSVGEEDFEHSAANLARKGIDRLALIGGDGTMWACREFERAGRGLRVIGIPKTVDNDLAGTDHAPGFGSAARFVAAITRDTGKDLESMRNFESVRIIETMGRNAGWLAMSAGLLKDTPEAPPHHIYIPERRFDEEIFLREISETHRRYGYAVAVVSEGLTPHGKEAGLRSPIRGGVSRELAETVRGNLGLPARDELLGMGQRSFALAVSERDWEEAWMLGEAAARSLIEGRSGVMLGLEREPGLGYAVGVREVPFDEVVGVERVLPGEWVPESSDVVLESFRRWLRPLAGEDLTSYPRNLSVQKTKE